ncbi:MAG: OOP family OmpA-OmpF porin [Zhongshania sp.]|jgi:OOP family OmpA-OmpF porin
MRYLGRALLLLGSLAAATSVMAQEREWYFNGGVGYQFFDNDRDLDDTAALVIGVEAKLTDNWGVELATIYSEPDDKNNNSGLDSKFVSGSLSLLRYFNVDSNFVPYLATGVGSAVLQYDNNPLDDEDEYTQYNLGGGFRYVLSESLSLRTDARYLLDDDNDYVGGLVSIGLSYAFASDNSPAVAPVDTDGDGVVDRNDRCPDTLAGVSVDRKGCPLDDDADGVPNYKDKCSQTPAGRQVDEFGCEFVLKQAESIKLEINFAYDSDVVPAAYVGELKKVADFMKKFGGVSAVVEGHADSTGSDVYNKQLSQRRADAVRNALIGNYGIAANRLSAVGYGEERSIADNKTDDGRLANRRVIAVMQSTAVE